MKLLTAVNSILPKLGEHPVTNLDTKHPTLAIILPLIDITVEDTTMQGWWFNSFDTTLYPDPEGNVYLPSDTLAFVADDGLAVQRGNRLYDGVGLTYIWAKGVAGNIVTRVPFEELPESAASAVWYTALVNSYVTDIGMADDVRVWELERQKAVGRMQAEHLRHKKYSTQKSPRYARWRRALRG